MSSRVEVITSVERRRRWSQAEKERLVAASFEPGVSTSEVARGAGLHVSQLFRWRKALCARPAPGFLPVAIASVCGPHPEMPSEPPPVSRTRGRPRAGAIEITLPGGERVRAEGPVDPDVLARVLAALRGR